MKKTTVVILITIVVGSVAKSQNIPRLNIPPETTAALEKIDQAFDENLKGWTRERATPFQPSSGLAERWQTHGRNVRIFISKLSPETANLYKDPASGDIVEGICDEARVFGYNGNISCRHGEFGVSVSADVRLDLWSIDKPENSPLDWAEEKATSRLIACFIHLALDGKLTTNWPHSRKPAFTRPCEQELMRKGLISENILRQYKDQY